MNLKYTIFLYLILILFIFIWKPHILMLNTEDKKRKTLYLIFLIIIISIISFYTKVLFEWFF
jgi:uncharacterized membrane protein